MINHKDKTYYVRAIDYYVVNNYNVCNYSQNKPLVNSQVCSNNVRYSYILRLTENPNSAKKWKTQKGLIKSIYDITFLASSALRDFHFQIGRTILNINKNGIWFKIINILYKKEKENQKQIFSNLKLDKNIIVQAQDLINTTKGLEKIKKLRGEKNHNQAQIIDSSHNFRKVKLEQIEKILKND